MRLIDGDALERSIRDYADRKCTNGEVELANGILKALSCVRKAPTIDPVKRGEWVKTRTDSGEIECVCSICREDAPAEYGRYTWIKSDFCPSCGARMDGDPE